MGFYSFGRLKIISRNGSKSAVATAAYHAGIVLTNEYDGVTHDYSKKQNVEGTFIRLPESAPDNWRDENLSIEERLHNIWNTIETQHSASNARLARTNFIALQKNLTLEQNLECVDRFIKENCINLGMGVVYSVHNKPNNPHVDVMYLVSEYNKDGKPKSKSKKEYFCRNRVGEEVYLDSEGLKNSDGFEKVYKYQKDGARKDMTASEASEMEGWERINKYPVCRTVKVSGWDDLNLAEQWRKSWEVILNEKFEELGILERVDCRSHKERGISHLPTVHEGWGSSSKERKEYNKQIREYNREVDQLFDEGMQAVFGAYEQINEMREVEQTEESLNKHEADYQARETTLVLIAQSGLMSKTVEELFNSYISDLRKKMNALIITLREYVKGRQERNIELLDAAEQAVGNIKKSLDSIINSAADRTVNSSAVKHEKENER